MLALDVVLPDRFATTHSIPALKIAVAVVAFALASANTIYQAILPEFVPRFLWGVSTGMRGAFRSSGRQPDSFRQARCRRRSPPPSMRSSSRRARSPSSASRHAPRSRTFPRTASYYESGEI